MILTHKIALDPTVKQEQYFRRAADTARFVWNWALAKWKELSEQGEKPNALKLKKLWNAIKRTQYPWVYGCTRMPTNGPLRTSRTRSHGFSTAKQGIPPSRSKGYMTAST